MACAATGAARRQQVEGCGKTANVTLVHEVQPMRRDGAGGFVAQPVSVRSTWDLCEQHERWSTYIEQTMDGKLHCDEAQARYDDAKRQYREAMERADERGVPQ